MARPVQTLRTNRETTTEGFHDKVLSDHIAPNREANQQVSSLGSRPRTEGGTSQARQQDQTPTAAELPKSASQPSP